MASSLLGASTSQAQDWGATATISSTMGVNDGRLCLGEASRGDIGCPTYAPFVNPTNGYVGIGTESPVTPLHVSGTGAVMRLIAGGDSQQDTYTNYMSSYDNAGNLIWYLGDGSSIAKRIILAARGVSSTYYSIDFETGASTRMRITSQGQVGIGSAANLTDPSTTLDVKGTIRLATETSTTLQTCDTNRTGAIKYQSGDFFYCRNGTAWESLTSISGGGTEADRIISGTTGIYTYSNTSATIATAGVERVVIGTDGNVGIGQQPVSGIALSVSGTTKIYSAATTGTAFTLQNGDSNGRGYAFTSTASANAMGPGNLIVTDLTAGLHRFALVSSGYVGIGTVAPSTTLHISGTLRIADGAESCDADRLGALKYTSGAFYLCQNTSNGWEPLATSGATANADRITSNSQAGVTANSSGYISLTTGGVTGTAYFTPASVLVNAGVSTTGPISGSNGYFTGSLGIGTSTPSSMVEISATTAGLTINYANTASDFGAVLFKTNGLNRWLVGGLPSASSVASNAFVIMQAADSSDAVLNRIAIAVTNNSYVGINTSVPSTTLDVQGTLRVAYSGEACDASRLGGIGYTSNDIYVCRNGTSWESLTSISAGSTPDRIISGTTGVYTYSDTSASIATAGVERLVVGTNGNIGIGQQPIANIALSTSGTSYFSGNVGIGTSTPASALHISGTAIPLRLSGSGDSNLDSYTNYIAAYDGDGLTVWRLGDDFPSQRRVVISARGPSAAYYPLDLETALVTRMRILSTGEVGIGTVNPSTTLHVSGTARANTLQLPDQAAIGTCDSTSHNTMKFVNGRPYYCRP